MGRRLLYAGAVVVLVLAACSSDKKPSAQPGSQSASTATGKTVTVQVDNKSDQFAFEATEYFPKDLTVEQGSTVKFHMNFEGEPHTVTLGTSIDKGLGIFSKLTDEQKNGPPPPEIAALKIPFIFDQETADFSDPGSIKFNQSAAQPCVTKAGEFAPGLEACPTKTAPEFDGTQAMFNSGLLKDDESFNVKLADSIPTGTYSYFCLFHGPEMSGTINVVGKGDSKAQDSAAVDAAGKQQLADDVAKVKPEVDKARSSAKPGEVKAGAGPEQSSASAVEFLPKEVSIKVGEAVTWNLSFHTVAFNASEDARTVLTQESNGDWHFNGKALTPSGYTPPPPPPGESGGPGSSDQGPPPPTNVDGGSFDGTGYFSSGSINAPGDVIFKLTFTKAGTYAYICQIHPDMKGTVKVT